MGLYRGHYPALLWRAAAHGSHARGDHSGLQSGRDRGQLRRRVVRHSREHLRELADGVRFAAGQAVSRLPDSA